MASSLLKGLSDTGVCFGEQTDVFLSENDILCLLDNLVEVSPKWERLGIALRLPGYVISQCKDDDNIKALYNILHKWVHGSYKGAFPATLENLKQRLGSQIVGEGRVADKLKVEILTSQLPVSCPAKRQCVRPHSDTQKVSRQGQSKLQYEIKSDHHIRRLAEKMTGWEEKYDLFHLEAYEFHDIKHGANRDRPVLQR